MAATTMLTLRFFASLREALALGEERFEAPPAVRSVGDLRACLAARGGAWERIGGGAVRCAVNQDIADDATPVRAGDEVAFFPPVTGG